MHINSIDSDFNFTLFLVQGEHVKFYFIKNDLNASFVFVFVDDISQAQLIPSSYYLAEWFFYQKQSLN
jgi:hypothetical protein